MTAFAARYILQVRRRQITPSLATWLTFTAGVVISFVSYLVASDRDIAAGVLNTGDICVVLAVSISVGVTRGWVVSLTPFERFYLAAAGAIVLYGVVFSDAWKSNMFSQVLITAGYIPLYARMIRERRNTESFSSWSIALAASLSGMGPAILQGNALAILYSSRSAISCAVCLIVMAYFHVTHLREGHAET